MVVVVPPEDSDEGPAVARAARDAGAFVVAPRERPAEMRDSIEIGLRAAAKPTTPDRVLLSPGDAGCHASSCCRAGRRELSSAGEDRRTTLRRRRGHPLVLPWKLAAEIPLLPAGQGVNTLLARHQALVVRGALLAIRTSPTTSTTPKTSAAGKTDRPAADGPAAGVRVQVRFFALARERAGCSEIDLELTAARRVSDVRAEIARRLPVLAPLMNTVMIALNEEYADDAAEVAPCARIAVIPPVSGGGGAPPSHAERGGTQTEVATRSLSAPWSGRERGMAAAQPAASPTPWRPSRS